jgi:peptide/nickel transport system substrate-binding protein
MIEGDAEVMLWPGEESIKQIEAAGVARRGEAPGIWVLELRFNLSQPFDGAPGATPPHPILSDRRVREAMTYAINRDRIIDELFESRFFHIESPFAVGWIDCQVAPFTYDPEMAKQLLDEVGWRDEDGDGIREAHGVEGVADGTPLSLSMSGYTGYEPIELGELAVQEDLKAVGIEVKVDNQEFAVAFGTYEDGSPRMVGDFDMLFYDDGFQAEPGKEIFNFYHPSQVPTAETPGGRNIVRWVREDVGAWIDAASSSADIDARRENYCKVAGAYREDIPGFPIFQFGEGSIYANQLHGFAVSTWEHSTWDAENWWVEQG